MRYFAIALGAFYALLTSLNGSITVEPVKLGNLFLDDEAVQVPITCEGIEVTWSCCDYFGERVSAGREVPKNKTAVITPEVTGAGYYELEIKELDGETVLSTIKTSFGILTRVDVDTMNASRFGVMTHFAQFHDQSVIPLIARAGIAHIRDEQYWNNIENPKGMFSYPVKFTDYVTKVTAHSITPLVVLNWANQFYDYEAGAFTAPHTDSGRLGYANYALNVLNKYPQIKAVEVWNEYNGGTFVTGPATTKKAFYYKKMLQQVYERVKPAHPEVKVVAGATIPVAHGFFKAIFDQGALSFCDAVSVHPYYKYPDQVVLALESLRELMGSNIKPIWATEFSDTVVDGDSDRHDTASYIAQIVTLMLSQGVERMYYYLIMDDRRFPLMGLVGSSPNLRGEFRPHPALIAYAVAARQFDRATYQSRFRTAPSVYAFRFERDAVQLSVLWSNRPLMVSLSADSALQVIDIMGRASTITPIGGRVDLGLTKDVQYVLGPVTSVAEIDNDLLADSVSGYSKTAGANGWHYGYATLDSTSSYDPAEFKPMTWGIWGSHSYRWLASGGYPFASGSNMHPSRSWAIRRWVSNISGTVSLSGLLSLGEGGDGVNIHIFVDGKEIYYQHLSPNQSINYDVPDVALEDGSKIDFTVNQADESSFDATNFTSTIIRQGFRVCCLSGKVQTSVILTCFGSTVWGRRVLSLPPNIRPHRVERKAFFCATSMATQG